MRPLRAAGAIGAILLAVVACTTPAHLRPIPPRGPIPADSRISVDVAPVPLDSGDPARREIDGFRYAGGLALTSSVTSRLHGLSDLAVMPDGTFVSPTDDGDIVDGMIRLGPDGRLAGIDEVSLRPLRGLDGEPLQGKSQGDAEGLAWMPRGMLISFERNHRIWSYDLGRPTPVVMPDARFAENDGMEGLAPARGPGAKAGAFWVGGEPGGVWYCVLQASCTAVSDLPVPPSGYRLSGLASGPGGELVVLHHSYIPAIGSRIIVTVVRDPMGAKTVVGRLAMGPSATVDNFEGVAVVARPNGDWRLYLLSDDNFNDKQRTILLAFDWTPPK